MPDQFALSSQVSQCVELRTVRLDDEEIDFDVAALAVLGDSVVGVGTKSTDGRDERDDFATGSDDGGE